MFISTKSNSRKYKHLKCERLWFISPSNLLNLSNYIRHIKLWVDKEEVQIFTYKKMGEETAYVPNYSSVDRPTNEVTVAINHAAKKYPFCLVWTPIPLLTWILPVVGHMGIATSSGVIRDFAGPYFVGTGNMAFGKPTKYVRLEPSLAVGGVEGWDKAVAEASEVYKNRNHNLCFDNCHSHVAMALNLMKYDNSSSWNMVKLAFLMFFCGKYVSVVGFLLSWVPFFILFLLILSLSLWVN